MLSNLNLVSVSFEQAAITLSEASDVQAQLDSGSIDTTLATHPNYGPMVVIQNTAGGSVIALRQEHIEAFTNAIQPNLSH